VVAAGAKGALIGANDVGVFTVGPITLNALLA